MYLLESKKNTNCPIARDVRTYLAPHLLLPPAHHKSPESLLTPTFSLKEHWELESRVSFPINEAEDDISGVFAADVEDKKEYETGEEKEEEIDVWGSDTWIWWYRGFTCSLDYDKAAHLSSITFTVAESSTKSHHRE